MKKVLSLLIVLFVLVSAAVSCGSEKPTADTSMTADTGTGPAATDTLPETTGKTPDTDGPEIDPASVTPLLWRVTDASGHELYLFGTIHVGDRRTTVALEKLAGRIRECDALAVEFDAVAYENDMAAMMADMQKYVLTDGTRITDHMPAELYEQAKAELEKASLYNGFLDFYKLALWSQLVENALLMNESKLDTEYGMDGQLIRFAYDNGIDVLDVESASFQTGVMLDMSDELHVFLIKSSLEHKGEYGEQVDGMYEAWVAGDEDGIIDYDSTETDEYTEEELALIEEYNKALIYDRNIGMADKAEEYLAAGQKTFFAVGTGHMVGEGGIADLLTQRGYKVEKISVD